MLLRKFLLGELLLLVEELDGAYSIYRNDLIALLVLKKRLPHLHDGLAVLRRVLRVEDLVQLFQCPAFGLHKEEVDEPTACQRRIRSHAIRQNLRKLEAVPEDEEDVELHWS